MTIPPASGDKPTNRPGERFTRTAVAWEIFTDLCDMIEFATILGFAVLQSIFGIGILFFGTPTLLLLGFPFYETLSILLPASLAVSLFQVIGSGLPDSQRICGYVMWCLAPLAIALTGGLTFGWDLELESIVAATLLLYVIIRLSPRTETMLQHSVRRLPQAWLVAIGTIHGLSNLGGGLLAIFTASRFDNKQAVRSNIAFCYLCFAAIQLGALAILRPDVMHLAQLGYAALAIVVFVIVDRLVFGSIVNPVFDKILTMVIGCYSALIILKLTGVLQAPAAT